jgi:transposase
LIAEVLFKGYLPKITISDPRTREIRELIRSRLTLVNDRSRNMIRLKILLDKLGLSTGHLTEKQLPSIYQNVIQDYKERITYLTQKLYQIKKQIIIVVNQDPDMKRLETIPGIGSFSAALIKTEIADMRRFSTFNKLCAYAGLAPKTFSSADKIYHGPINKNRRKYLQWILLENVYKFIRALPDKNRKFEKLKKLKNHNVAKVILARDLLKIIYHVLKDQRAFYYV